MDYNNFINIYYLLNGNVKVIIALNVHIGIKAWFSFFRI